MGITLGKEESLSETAVSGRDFLLNKTRRIVEQKLMFGDQEVLFRVSARSSKEILKLVEKHPARKNDAGDQRIGFNRDTLTPELLADSVLEPKLSEAEWTEVWGDENYSAGEQGDLFDLVWGTSNRGFDVPFGARG